MGQEKLQLNLTGDGIHEIRLGEAPEVLQPKQMVVDGNFYSVSSFLQQRGKGIGWQEVNEKSAVVTCDKEKLTIQYESDPNDRLQTIVTGKAQYSPELEQFGINTGKMFNREQLVKLIRFGRMYFPNKVQHEELLKAYQQFEAKAQKEISQSSDNRGNAARNYNKQVSTNVPTDFALEIPVFKGEPKEKFFIEICIEDSDAGVRFWFESVELAELIEKRKEDMFARELQACEGLCIIWK